MNASIENKRIGWGLTPEQADKLIAMGPDACNYFQHCFPEVMWLLGHQRPGCIWCARASSKSGNG